MKRNAKCMSDYGAKVWMSLHYGVPSLDNNVQLPRVEINTSDWDEEDPASPFFRRFRNSCAIVITADKRDHGTPLFCALWSHPKSVAVNHFLEKVPINNPPSLRAGGSLTFPPLSVSVEFKQ